MMELLVFRFEVPQNEGLFDIYIFESSKFVVLFVRLQTSSLEFITFGFVDGPTRAVPLIIFNLLAMERYFI